MKHYRTIGINNVEDDVWDFYSYEEMTKHKSNCVNWKHCLRDGKKYIGQLWHSDEIRYLVNGIPVYKMYRIVGFEDNNAWCDYYWIVRPIDAKDDKKDEYKLWNYRDFYENIVFKKKRKKKK